jgi:hypothetical protein
VNPGNNIFYVSTGEQLWHWDGSGPPPVVALASPSAWMALETHGLPARRLSLMLDTSEFGAEPAGVLVRKNQRFSSCVKHLFHVRQTLPDMVSTIR